MATLWYGRAASRARKVAASTQRPRTVTARLSTYARFPLRATTPLRIRMGSSLFTRLRETVRTTSIGSVPAAQPRCAWRFPVINATLASRATWSCLNHKPLILPGTCLSTISPAHVFIRSRTLRVLVRPWATLLPAATDLTASFTQCRARLVTSMFGDLPSNSMIRFPINWTTSSLWSWVSTCTTDLRTVSSRNCRTRSLRLTVQTQPQPATHWQLSSTPPRRNPAKS